MTSASGESPAASRVLRTRAWFSEARARLDFRVVFLVACATFLCAHWGVRETLHRHPWVPNWACGPLADVAFPGPLLWEVIERPKGKVSGPPWAFISSSVGRAISCEVITELGGVNLALQGANYRVLGAVFGTLQRLHPEYRIIAELNAGMVLRGSFREYYHLLMNTLGRPPNAAPCFTVGDFTTRTGPELQEFLPKQIEWCTRRVFKPFFFLEEARQKLQLHYFRGSLTGFAQEGMSVFSVPAFWKIEEGRYLHPAPDRVADPKNAGDLADMEGLYDFSTWDKTEFYREYRAYLDLLRQNRDRVLVWVPSINPGYYPYVREGHRLRELEERVRKEAREMGLEVMPPHFLETDEYSDDAHMNSRGAAKFAKVLIQWVKEKSR